MQFSTNRPRALAVLLTGCVVGVLDGVAAVTNAWLRSGITPGRVFRYIASALFGNEAYAPGWVPVMEGVIIHFLIACIWSLLFFLFYPRITLLRQNKWIVGACYGVLVWLVMTFIVLPLSLVPPLKFSTQGVLTGLAIHMLVIGIPISLLANKWYDAHFPASKPRA